MEGFVEVATAPATRLLARPDLVEAAVAAGLGDPEGWEEIIARGVVRAGRGGLGRLVLPCGTRLVLKRMRRGGLLGHLWRDRFAGRGRIEANLTVPLEALRRGVPTARPAALLQRAGPPGLTRAWLATEELPDACDLLTRLRTAPPSLGDAALAMRAVRRMHDAGIEHRDLNLGNIVLGEGQQTCAWVVDLDGARLHPGPVPARTRAAGLRRLERSYTKHFGDVGPLGAAGTLTALYAGVDGPSRPGR